ncbi:hypothetical protein LINPERPRIM_LOCUS5400 [Linum perenne]
MPALLLFRRLLTTLAGLVLTALQSSQMDYVFYLTQYRLTLRTHSTATSNASQCPLAPATSLALPTSLAPIPVCPHSF